MRNAFVVLGPTATGKTALAIELAKKIEGELFSADSIQVYQSLDIISGKDLLLLKNTPIHLLDLVPPTVPFSVSNYLESFSSQLNQLSSQKTPIIVGGTGFYIYSLLNGVETAAIKPNLELRKQLEKSSVEELQNELQKLDFAKFSSMNNSDRNNSRRLMRAIEVARYLNQESRSMNQEKLLGKFDLTVIGLKASTEYINNRIDLRVKQRLKDGAVDEARKLFEQYNELASQVKTANGYKQLFGYLKREYGLPEAIEKWKLAEYANAKKQMTWFKKLENVLWFDISKASSSQLISRIQSLVV